MIIIKTYKFAILLKFLWKIFLLVHSDFRFYFQIDNSRAVGLCSEENDRTRFLESTSEQSGEQEEITSIKNTLSYFEATKQSKFSVAPEPQKFGIDKSPMVIRLKTVEDKDNLLEIHQQINTVHKKSSSGNKCSDKIRNINESLTLHEEIDEKEQIESSLSSVYNKENMSDGKTAPENNLIRSISNLEPKKYGDTALCDVVPKAITVDPSSSQCTKSK